MADSSNLARHTQPLLFDIKSNPSQPDIGKYQDFQIIPHTRFSIVPEHCHNYVELSYIYSGSVSQTINKQFVTLKKGQIVLINTGISHSINMNSAYLLTHTSLPIYEIANTAGYENLSFFFGKFKEHYGMTPQEYREQHRLPDPALTGK